MDPSRPLHDELFSPFACYAGQGYFDAGFYLLVADRLWPLVRGVLPGYLAGVDLLQVERMDLARQAHLVHDAAFTFFEGDVLFVDDLAVLHDAAGA